MVLVLSLLLAECGDFPGFPGVGGLGAGCMVGSRGFRYFRVSDWGLVVRHGDFGFSRFRYMQCSAMGRKGVGRFRGSGVFVGLGFLNSCVYFVPASSFRSLGIQGSRI